MSDKPLKVGVTSVGPVLAFTAADVDHDVLVRFDEGTIWLTQVLMGELFGVDRRTVSEHLTSFFASGELEESVTVRNFRTVRTEGSREVTRNVSTITSTRSFR